MSDRKLWRVRLEGDVGPPGSWIEQRTYYVLTHQGIGGATQLAYDNAVRDQCFSPESIIISDVKQLTAKGILLEVTLPTTQAPDHQADKDPPPQQ